MGGISLIDVMRFWRGLLFFPYVFPLYHKGSPTLETACKKKQKKNSNFKKENKKVTKKATN
jgi:hypothetical protein